MDGCKTRGASEDRLPACSLLSRSAAHIRVRQRSTDASLRPRAQV